MRSSGRTLFADRRQAGRRLGEALDAYRGRHDVVVCGLPRGGVPVAFEVARHLDADLDVIVVRKLGVPGHEELAMGAVASGGVLVRNDWVIERLGIADSRIDEAVDAQRHEVDARERRFRGDRPPRSFRGRTVIVVDDGIATGSTMQASIQALRASGVAEVVVAVPVASSEACDAIRPLVDDLICLRTPDPFQAVGLAYDDFTQTTDDEVRRLLTRADSDGT
jgi:putative phosphoribosyl transferase